MNRRQWIAGTGGLIGALAAVASPGRRRSSAWAAQGSVAVESVEAVGAKLAVGDEVEFEEGIAVRFVAVGRDDRCPADVMCDAPGSAFVSLEMTLSDDRRNERTFDQEVEFPLRRRVLVYDTDEFAILAGLSGDSDVDDADLVLSLYLVVTES